MELQCSPLSWPYYYQDEGIEELKHYVLQSTVELETTIPSAQEELARKDDEIVHLKSLVSKVAEERDEALAKCRTIMVEKLLLHQQLQEFQQQRYHHHQQQQQLDNAAPVSSGTTTGINEGDQCNNIVHSSSDSDENFFASPVDVREKMVVKKPLPEKGKFLQAVMEAGPLLQTLVLAGPLPQWQHPPPQLNTIDIPPVTISSPAPAPPRLLLHEDPCLSINNGCFSKKRALENGHEESDFSPLSKYQRVGCSMFTNHH